MNKDFSGVLSLLTAPKKVVITVHTHPDGDALGSALAMHHYLHKRGHQSIIITPDSYPSFLTWMIQNEEVLLYDKEEEKAQKYIEEADVLFSMDYSCLNRIKNMKGLVEKANAIKVIIDHHENPENFAQYLIHDIHAAATSELVFDLIKKGNDTHLIDKKISEFLYTGLSTDTGHFKHPNTTAKSHAMAAELIELGADTAKVTQWVYDNFSVNRIRFLGYSLISLLHIEEEKGVAYFVIPKKIYQKYSLDTGDTEGLVNYALSIQGIKFAAIFKEKGNEIRISFRSTGDLAVNTFASKYFDGGGHRNAAGGKSILSLKKTVEKFKKIIESNF